MRIAPNEISFASADSLETIYHGTAPKHGRFTKAYLDMFNIILPGPNIFTANKTSEHKIIRKKVEPFFSAKAFSKQEHLICKHIEALCKAVDVGSHLKQDGVNIVDLVSTSLFSLVSNFTFGEPLARGKSEQVIKDWL